MTSISYLVLLLVVLALQGKALLQLRMAARKPIIAGNWKLNTDLPSAVQLAQDIRSWADVVDTGKVEIVVIPPFPFLRDVSYNVGGKVSIGAQTCFHEDNGAFTGAVSPSILRSIGCKYVLVGHSERRKVFLETDADFNKAVKKVFAASMVPILCVGELKEDFELGVCREICTQQLAKSLNGVSAEEAKNLVIAYEPVWAIGTGLTATPAIAQSVHASIRAWLVKRFGRDVAEQIRIQYGGSVTPETIDELLSQPDIDGALVGGASLNAASFEKLVKYKASGVNPFAALYEFIGRTTKTVVVATAALSMIVTKSWLPVYYVACGVVNAIFSKVLKLVFKQSRPPGGAKSLTEYGMPSSHAQSLFYFTTIILSQFGPSRPVISTLVALYAVLAASWRVTSGLHTTTQTAVGAVVGSIVGILVRRLAPIVCSAVKSVVSSPLITHFLSNKFVVLNLVLLIGATVLYGPEIG